MTVIPPSLETIDDEDAVVFDEECLSLETRKIRHTLEMRKTIQYMSDREEALVKAIERTEAIQRKRFETRKMELMLEHAQNIEYLKYNHAFKMQQISDRMGLALKYELAKYAAYILMLRIERKEREFSDLFGENGQFEELLYEAIEKVADDSNNRKRDGAI